MIETNIQGLRDPFVLVEDDAYYVYGTYVTEKGNWNTTRWGCYKSEGGLSDNSWKLLDKPLYIKPEHAMKNFWAPEVHKYNGNYYMFATYYSFLTNHKGCSILKSESPEGQFEEITNGHITPREWNSIDATLYVDEDGQPWMVFVHEHTCTDDHIGRMAAAKLSDDLTHFISEPVELFRADDPVWTSKRVTDGCFMYKTKDGQLLMIWSNFYEHGYCVGVARSDNGKVDGKWSHDEKLLFSKEMSGKYDGGHGMIFNDRDGKMYLCLHSPNEPTDETDERTVFVPLVEGNGNLICKKDAE